MALEHVFSRSRDDDEIEEYLLAELTDGATTDRHLVTVAVEDGVVHLTGIVDSYARKCAIERAAARLVGVKDVRDYVEVRPPEEWRRDDRTIERAARRALDWDARLPVGLRADVTDGVVRLKGTVPHLAQRDAAEDTVRNLIGVRDVVNEIRVSTPPVREELAPQVEALLRRRFGPESRDICITTAGAVVTLTGVVSTFALVGDVEHAIGTIAGVGRIENQLLVA